MPATEYKVVEHEWINRSEPGEGPGSTHDVVSDGPFKRVVWRDELEAGMTNEQALAYLSDLLSDQMEEDNGLDCTEYRYFVYRNDDGIWRYAGTLTRVTQYDSCRDEMY